MPAEAIIFNVPVLCFALAALLITIAQVEAKLSQCSDKFGKFDVSDPVFGHPLGQLLKERNEGPLEPFILSERFYKEGSNLRQRGGTTLHPGGASYRKYGAPFESGQNLYGNADALVTSRFTKGGLVVCLRQKAEVVLVLQYRNKLKPTQLKDPRFAAKSGAGWAMVGGFERRDGPAELFFETASEKTGIAIKKRVTDSQSIGNGLYELEIPNVNQINVEHVGRPTNFIVLFVSSTGKAFSYPRTPKGLGFKEPIRPHSKCPPELHDMWKTESEDREDPDNYVNGKVGGAMIQHTIWHPYAFFSFFLVFLGDCPV